MAHRSAILRATGVGVLLAASAVSGSGLQQRPRIRFGPGVCGPIDPAYAKGATETGGQVFPLSAAEIGAAAPLMSASSLDDMILWASADGERAYAIPVDATVKRLVFSGTFDKTGGSVALVAPDGAVVQSGEGTADQTLNCGRIVTVEKPAAGIWQARVTPTGVFWFVVHAKTDLSLSGAEFVEPEEKSASGRLVRIQGSPIAGMSATLRVSVSSAIKNPEFQLVSVDAQPLQALDLRPSDDGEFTGTITPSTEAFRVLVTGLDESGQRVQRISKGLLHGEAIEVVPPPATTIAAATATPVTFTLRNHGAAVRLSLVSSNSRGHIVAVDPPKLELKAGEEATATVVLTVPADAAAGSSAEIRLTASVDGAGQFGGYNSASTTFTVGRDRN